MSQIDDCSHCRELQEKIRLLALENDQLAERAEETLLLGLIAEKVSATDDFEELVSSVLEQVALLKNIPFCAWCAEGAQKVEILRSYSLLSDQEFVGATVNIPPAIIEELASGACLLEGDDCRQVGLPHEQGVTFEPTSIFFIPFKVRNRDSNFLIFADDSGDEHLSQMRYLLQRLVEMMVSRLDNLLLLRELRGLTIELDRKVAERTRELEVSNESLKQRALERRVVEEAMRVSELRFRALFENAVDAIFVFDEQLRFVDVNQRACHGLGYSREELLGMGFADIDVDLDSDSVQTIVGTLSSEQSQTFEGKHRKKDGTCFAVEVRVGLLTSNDQQLVLASARDISERKSLEEQLGQAMKMEAVGRLAGGVAHDFNNILTTIMGYSDLALMALPAGDKVRADIETIRAAGERASSLTRQLLVFSRKQVIALKSVNLNEIITEMSKMLVRMIGEDVELKLELDSAVGTLLADPGKLEQILMNLSVNARDAMPDGGELVISTSSVFWSDKSESGLEGEKGLPGRYILLSVSDSGNGIPADILDNIFEPFFTTKETGKGTGLGLSTVYGIVKQHNGHIRVVSEVGLGTTFNLYLPEISGSVEEKVVAGSADTQGGNELILLVEDDEAIRKILSVLVTRLGYELLVAKNGQEALEVISDHHEPINLLLTDVVMPKMNGKELADHFKKVHPETKVIFMSGYTDDIIGRHGVLEPGVNFLQKPILSHDLGKKIRSVLDSSGD